MHSIRVLNDNGAQIALVDLEHNEQNVEMAARRYIKELGRIVSFDHSSDCMSLVQYENGLLGFSI